MKKFSTHLQDTRFHGSIDFPSVELSFAGNSLFLLFDSSDILAKARYQGTMSPWLSSLCEMTEGKSLSELQRFSLDNWKEHYRDDQVFWDCFLEIEENFIHPALELLKGALDIYRGVEYLYFDESALVCRCFGVRESDIRIYLKETAQPDLAGLSKATKAGLGCRSCLPQLQLYLSPGTPKRNSFINHRPVVDWLLDIDAKLKAFPYASEWKMEVSGLKNNLVTINFDKEVSQKEEEQMNQKVQDFFSEAFADFSFFLRRARHFSKANG